MIPSASLTEQFVPLQLRSITLVVVDLLSPYYLDMLPGSREALLARATEQQTAMQRMGFNKVMIPAKDFTADDYSDRVHLWSTAETKWRRHWRRSSADGFGFGVSAMTLRKAFSFWAGLAVAVVFHYALYRIAQPVTPFIYVVF